MTYQVDDKTQPMESPFTLSINRVCLRHDEELHYYCPNHDDVLCRKCVETSHSRCPAQIAVLEEAKISKASLWASVAANFKILNDNVKNALDHQRGALSVMTSKEEQARKQIRDIRVRLNRKLDELEASLSKSWMEQRQTIVPKMKTDISRLEQCDKEISKLEYNLTKIKDFGTDIDFFLAGRQVKEKLYDDEEEVATVVRDLKGINASFVASTDFDAFISKVTKIGDLHVEGVPGLVTVKRLIGEKKRVVPVEEERVPPSPDNSIKQVFIDKRGERTPPPRVDETPDIFKIKLALRNRFEMLKGFLKKNLCICNGIILNDQIFFTDRENKRFVIMTIDGDHIQNMDVTGRPWGVASIGDKSLVVVTFPYIGSGYIEILDASNNKVEKPINIGGLCRGISFYEGNIYVVVYGKGIMVVDLEGKVKSEIPINVNGVFHLTVDHQRIYYSDEWVHTLYCCDLSGNLIWQFNHERLRDPQGITTDENGNVFVASYLFDNIIVVSEDGRKHREILSKADGLLGPSSIFYDKQKRYLLVSSREHGRVSIFHVL